MPPRHRTATFSLITAVLCLTEMLAACTGGDEAEPNQAPTPEARALAREKCDQAARIFRGNAADMDVLRRTVGLFEEAVALDPELVEAHVGLGGAYRAGVHYGWFSETPSLEKAEASFERAIGLDPTHMPAYVGLLLVNFTRGDPERILRVGDRARRTGGSASEIRMTRAWSYFVCFMPDLTLDLIGHSSAGRPSDPLHQFLLAVSNAWAGRFENAIREGERFLETFGEEAEIHLWIAGSYHCLGNLEAARAHYEGSMDLYGSNTNQFGPIMAGICYEDLGRPEEARRIWREAKISLENRFALIQDNRLLRYYLEIYRVLLGEATQPTGTYGFSHFLVAALAHQGRTEDAVRILDGLESGAVYLRSLAPAIGFRDIDAPVYREALERLEAREARLRELYGPL